MQSTFLRRSLVAAAAGTLAAGCGGPQKHLRPEEIRPLPHGTTIGSGPAAGPAPVRGLREALARSPDAPVRVLVLHGMRTFEPGYSSVLQSGLSRRLGLQPQRSAAGGDSVAPTRIVRGYEMGLSFGPQPLDSVTLRPSEIRTRRWLDGRGRDRVVFYEMLWAPLRDDVKDRFFACFESGPRGEREPSAGGRRKPGARVRNCPLPRAGRNKDKRAWVNGQLKDEVLVDGIADATIVLGPVGDALRDDVTLAFCMIATDILREGGMPVGGSPDARCDLARSIRPQDRQTAGARLSNTEFFGMTHSLGSFLLMDAHVRAMAAAGRRDGEEDGDASVRDVLAFSLLDDATVFMRANQIALLQLALLTPRCQGAICPRDTVASWDELMAGGSPTSTMTMYVAFNDANDLLGFELPPYLSEPGYFGTLVNVSVRNPARWSLPFLFRNPGEAHTRSDENPAVLDAMVEGIRIPRSTGGGTAAEP